MREGSKNGRARLNEKQILEMRKMRYEGALIEDIAKKFNVSYPTARLVVRLKTWAHVKSPYDQHLLANFEELAMHTKHAALTQAVVRRFFTYDPEEGVLRWKIRGRGIQHGRYAGCLRGRYYTVRIFNVYYGVQDIIWLFMKGLFPKKTVDHIDGIPTNNKWNNLRLVTFSQNSMNTKISTRNTSGCKGVKPKPRGKWAAYLTVRGKFYALGIFDTKEEAIKVRKEAEKIHHGEFARTK